MKVYFDGGLRKGLMCIVNAGTNEVFVEKRKYNNEDYEWDALEMALIYALSLPNKGEVELLGDNNQVIRWIREDHKDKDVSSIIKQKCFEKIQKFEQNNVVVIGTWIPREQNLAGRVLEYHTRRSSKPTSFIAEWHSCPKCIFKSLSEKEKKEHFWNSHVMI